MSHVACFGTGERRFAHILLASLALALLSPGRGPAQVEQELCPPPVGTTLVQTTASRASLEVEIIGAAPTTLLLEGDTTTRQVTTDNGFIQTELLSMDLRGNSPLGPVNLHLSSRMPSTGALRGLKPAADGGCEASDSFFDVFIEVSFTQNPQVFHNQQPVHMVGEGPVPIRHDRPFAFVQVDPPQAPGVPLLDANNRQVGLVRKTRHDIVPPPPPPPPCYPPAGKDIMDSTLLHDIDIPGVGLCRANLAGPVTVMRSDPYIDPATGLMCINTEITSLLLQGVDPVCGHITITLDTFRKSRGRICEKVAGTCFPANSFFDVFVKVELKDLGMCLYACQPARMECMIDQIPPFGCLYNLNIGAGSVIPLFRGDCGGQVDPCAAVPRPQPAAFIVKAVHQPLPPKVCECFPPAGEDVLITNLGHTIVFPGINLSCSNFQGPMVIRRSAPYLDDQGLCCVKTEVIKLEMRGTCNDGTPAIIRLCPQRRSTGLICAKEPGKCFPANSCFDIFFEIEVEMPTGPMKFKNCRPATMCCMINAMPPLGCPYQLQNAPIELYKVRIDPTTGQPVNPCRIDPLPVPDGILENATHTPEGEGRPCCPEYGPGEDIFESTLLHDIEIPGIGTCKANLKGPVKVRRGTPAVDPATGLCCVEVEMVGLSLTGVDPLCGKVVVTLDPRRPSRGRICSKSPTACFPAESCFEVYVRIELPDIGRVLVACKPARMCCEINAIPPFGCLYNLNIGTEGVVPLYDVSTTIVGAGAGGGVPGAGTCVLPDNGTGTVDLPPQGCGYVSPDEAHLIIDGLPPGTTVRIGAEHQEFFGITRRAGGTLGGESEQFQSILALHLQGTGALSGFLRNLTVQAQCETHTGPRMPGDPVQSFPADMVRIQGQLPPGDPDFDLLRITAGTGFGLPSPGHTTLTRLPAGDFRVDSFFDITYRIDFVGAPGGPLGGLSGSTTGTIRMETGGGGGGTPTDPCDLVPPPTPTAFINKAVHQPEPPCDCFPPAGEDVMGSELSHRIRIFGAGAGGADLVCDADLSGLVKVRRSDPFVDPATGLCCIRTEIVEMMLEGVDPVCGPVRARLCPDRRSTGLICEKQPGTCFPANSFFDVFIEVEVPDLGVTLKTCSPVRMACMIDALPPLGCVYQLNLSAVSLFRPAECALLPSPNVQPSGVIEAASHQPTPCPPPTVTCKAEENANGSFTVTVAWTENPDCPCQGRWVVTRTNADGTTQSIPAPAGATSITDTFQCPPGATGTVQLRYCVQCVSTAGVLSQPPSCCVVEIPCGSEPCGIEKVNCDPAGDKIVITWSLVPGSTCCERFIITRDGQQVATAPATATSVTVPCLPGRYCVLCVLADGSTAILDPARHCCDVTPDQCQPIVGGLQRPCDCNQDGKFDISDAICALGFLFLGRPEVLPCGSGGRDDPSNLRLLDCNGDGRLDITDAVFDLNFLFSAGRPPVQGLGCIPIPDCPDKCDPAAGN